jgi:hypothetical protein
MKAIELAWEEWRGWETAPLHDVQFAKVSRELHPGS